MDSFDDCIRMRIPSCNWFPFEVIVVLTHLGKFRQKFGTTIKHNSLWKWVTSKPIFLGNICNFCSRFIWHLCHIELVYGRIDNCEAPKFERFFFPRDWFQPVWVAACHISDYLSWLFRMLGTSYTRCGLLYEGLYNKCFD